MEIKISKFVCLIKHCHIVSVTETVKKTFHDYLQLTSPLPPLIRTQRFFTGVNGGLSGGSSVRHWRQWNIFF